MPAADNERLPTVADAAKHLSVSADTVRRLGRAGELELLKVGNTTRVTRHSIDKYIRAPDRDDAGDLRLRTLKEAGRHLGVSRDTVRRLCHRGDLELIKVRGATRILQSDLDAYIRNAKRVIPKRR